jgi:hypothetical protein
MTLKDKIETLAEKQGWNDQTLFGLVVDFVDANGNGDLLMAYLEDVAAEDNKGTDMNNDDNDSGTMTANSALASLEESKRECPFYAAAIKAIEEDQQVIHDVAAEQMQIVDNVKDMGWFRDAVANEIELRHYQWVDEAKKAIAARDKLVVRFCEKHHIDLADTEHNPTFIDKIVEQLKINQTITNAFAYASGPDDPTLVDDDAVGLEDFHERALPDRPKLYEDGVEVVGKFEELAQETLDEVRLQAELAVMDANPVGAEPGGPDDNHGLSQTELVTLTLEHAALSREVVLLREEVQQKGKAYQEQVEALSAIHTTTADTLTETKAALRKANRTIGTLRKLLAKTIITIGKNTPQQPTAKRKALMAMAAELTKAIAKPAKKKS